MTIVPQEWELNSFPIYEGSIGNLSLVMNLPSEILTYPPASLKLALFFVKKA